MFESNRENEIAAAYNEWSKTYEAVENATRDLAARVLRERAFDLKNWDVLEIGCGTGLNTKYLAQHCRKVTAIDFSAGMLEQARANVAAQNVEFVRQDIQSEWAVADDSVNLIVCTLVLEHIENLAHVFAEAARVLRASGEFFLCELHPFRQMQGGQAQFANQISGDTTFIPAFLHDVSDYVNAGLGCGFKLIELGEWRDAGKTAKNNVPRLLSVLVRL